MYANRDNFLKFEKYATEISGHSIIYLLDLFRFSIISVIVCMCIMTYIFHSGVGER